jgi:hypothetical protein
MMLSGLALIPAEATGFSPELSDYAMSGSLGRKNPRESGERWTVYVRVPSDRFGSRAVGSRILLNSENSSIEEILQYILLVHEELGLGSC